MPPFQYTAVNSAGKKLTGVIDSPSEEDARKQLNTLGISILEIKKGDSTGSSLANPTTNLETFEFEAFDKSARKILGTIPAQNRYKAFQRLVEEYKFEVAYVVRQNATEEEREKAKAEDLSILKAEYESSNPTQNTEAQNAIDPEFEKKQKALLGRVDQMLEKIRGLLATYQSDIQPERKKNIQGMVDKLLRIKSSTNLDYIEHTCEELLKKIQDEELFLNKEKMENQREKLRLETRRMMAELHAPVDLDRNVSSDLGRVRNQLLGSGIPLVQSFARFLDHFVKSPEEKILQSRISAVNSQVFTMFRLYLTANKAVKNEAREALSAVWNERKRLKQELRELRNKERNAGIDAVPVEVTEPVILEELQALMGWILIFYVIAFILSYYTLSKTWPSGNPLPFGFKLTDSKLLKEMLISLFVWYGILNIKTEFFRYERSPNLLLIPIGLILNTTLLFNI